MTKPVKRYWKKHLERCRLHGAQRTKLSEANDKRERNKVNPTKTEYQLPLPFVIYADFKSVLRKQDSCEPSSSKSFATQYQHHIPCRSCNYVKCSDERYFEPLQVNIGDDATEKFLDQALAAATICRQHLANNIPMKQLTEEQWNNTKSNTKNNTTMSPTARSAPNHSSLQIKMSVTTNIWLVNIEVQLTTHTTWITTSMPFFV